MALERTDTLELLRTTGRLRDKKATSVDWSNLTMLPHERLAFVYPRLSTHEQRERSVWSIERQRWLEELARIDGYACPLTKEEVEALRSQPDYPGWYQNGQILVDERDLGISGTLGRESRLGLDHLIGLIEKNSIEAIYTVEISRLWRDKSLTGDRILRRRTDEERGIDVDDALRFGRLCKERNVVLILPHMRLNLADRMHWRIYRTEAERAAEELEMMQYRLGGARTMKARQGYHPGGPTIPVGFMLDADQASPTYQKIVPYPPHAEIVRAIIIRFVASGGSAFDVVTWCRMEGLRFPLPPPEIANVMKGRWSFSRKPPEPDGWPVTLNVVYSVVTNPKYIGWWIYKGEVVSKANHPAIVDEETFWEAVSLASTPRVQRRGKAAALPAPLLSGLLNCWNHEGEPRAISSSGSRGRHMYVCHRDYRDGRSAHYCFTVSDYILERPIVDIVTRHCSYPEQAEAVLSQVESDYEHEQAALRVHQLRRTRLRQEIATLQANSQALLASPHYTPQRHAELEAAVDAKQRQLQELEHAIPSERPQLTRQQIARVRTFLANIATEWPNLSLELQREFLTRIALKRVDIRHDKERIWCRLFWRSGQVQEMVIHRPFVDERVPWTPEEEEVLRQSYFDAPVSELLKMLPKRTWSGIRCHAPALGLERKTLPNGGASSSKPHWEEWEMDLLRQYYDARITRDELEEALPQRRIDTIKYKARRMGLRWVHRQPWEPNLRWEEVPAGTFDCAPSATRVVFNESLCRRYQRGRG